MEYLAHTEGKPWWEDRPYVAIGVTASVLLHLVIFLTVSAPTPISPPGPLVIDIILPDRAQPKRIVSPPDRIDPRPPEIETPNLSDTDSRTDKEQIKRGDAPDAGKAPSPKPGKDAEPAPTKKNAPPSSKKEPSPAPRALKEILLDNATSLSKFGRTQSDKKEDPMTQGQTSTNNSYLPFTRPSGSGARFVGSRGSSDFLPNLPDGDITLLNAKADQFAVFVRRVAAQVFSALRQSGWEGLTAADIYSLTNFCTVRAVMGLDGKLRSVTILGDSGSRRFDEILLAAAETGAQDRNPPPEAATPDGTINFIFQARSWVRGATAARTGAPIERRWLLLGTGLE